MDVYVVVVISRATTELLTSCLDSLRGTDVVNYSSKCMAQEICLQRCSYLILLMSVCGFHEPLHITASLLLLKVKQSQVCFSFFLFNLSYLNELQTLDSNPPAESLTRQTDVWRLAAPMRWNLVGTNEPQNQHPINMLKSFVPTFYQADSESRPLANHFLGLNCFPKAALR